MIAYPTPAAAGVIASELIPPFLRANHPFSYRPNPVRIADGNKIQFLA
jgi:hypothetical protein